MGHYASEMRDVPEYDRVEETAKAVEMPLAQDVHEAINQISNIDQEIKNLHKQKARIQERIDNSMNEVQKHYSDVIHGPQESPEY